jgi:hypothetical protein
MSRWFIGLASAVLVLVVGVVLGQSGLLSITGPQFPDFRDVEVEVALPDEARIVAIEPISLDCRARVHAEVPVEGVRDHDAFGLTYRTDRVTLNAIGDVDTCVDGSATEVIRHGDGTTEVVIDAESIVFVRPRVDAVATAESLMVEQGVVGKLADVFPWVDDNLGLTPLAYAYAQNVIGSSECMETAYSVTQDVLIEAYRDQLVDQGVDSDSLEVRIEGEPVFTDPADIDTGEIELSVGGGEVSCVADDSLEGATAIPQM